MKQSYTPFRMMGSWVGFILILLLFSPAMIGTFKMWASEPCLGSQDCKYNEACSNLYSFWESRESWFKVKKEGGGACGEFDIFCVESSICQPITNCNLQQYAHIMRDSEVTWHMCIDRKTIEGPFVYDFYCVDRNSNCKVYDSHGNVVAGLTTGNNPELVDTTTLPFIRHVPFVLMIAIIILSIIGFIIGWGVQSLVRVIRR